LAEPVQSREPRGQHQQCACSGQDETGNEEKSADAGEVAHGTPSLILDAIVNPRRDAKDDHEQGGEEHDDDDQGDNRETALDQTLKPLGHPTSPSAWRRSKTVAKYSCTALIPNPQRPSPPTPSPVGARRGGSLLGWPFSLLPPERGEGLGMRGFREKGGDEEVSDLSHRRDLTPLRPELQVISVGVDDHGFAVPQVAAEHEPG
jgi:hypothetical protein